jgi:hypothetical protein
MNNHLSQGKNTVHIHWMKMKQKYPEGNKHSWFILGPLSTAEIYHIFFIIQKYACLVCNDPNVLLNWFFVKREIYLHYNLYSKDFIRNIFMDFIIISVKNVLRVSFSDPCIALQNMSMERLGIYCLFLASFDLSTHSAFSLSLPSPLLASDWMIGTSVWKQCNHCRLSCSSLIL